MEGRVMMKDKKSDYPLKNNIRRLRLDRGQISQQQLGELAGCTRQTIIAIESGNYTPSLLLAFKIAEALNSPIGEVFYYENEEGEG